MLDQVMEVMATQPTRYWTSDQLKGKLESFSKSQLREVGTKLTAACWRGEIAHHQLSPTVWGYRLLPNNWPDEKQFREDVFDIMSDRQPRSARELSNAVSLRYLKYPCDTIFNDAIGKAAKAGMLERLDKNPVILVNGPFRLTYRYWLLSQVSA
jgi:hypothetical protein